MRERVIEHHAGFIVFDLAQTIPQAQNIETFCWSD
jgi:hypothetical protein